LTQSFGKRNCAGERDIQRASAPAQRDNYAGRRGAVHAFGRSGAFAAEKDRIVRRKSKMMQWDGSHRRHQDKPRFWVASGEKSPPRKVAAELKPARVIEGCAFEPPVIKQETARLDQIDSNPKTRREPKQSPGILWYVWLEQGETHVSSCGWSPGSRLRLYSVCC